MNPKNSEDAPLKKTEKENRRLGKPLVVKEEWVREWFEKIKKEKGEYVHGNTLDGYFSLDELAEFLTKKLTDSHK